LAGFNQISDLKLIGSITADVVGGYESVSFGTVIALAGLAFGIISIKLMSTIEKAQVVIVKQIDSSVRHGRHRHRVTERILAFTISSQRLAFLKFGAATFARISSIIFEAGAMYPEKAVEGAAFAMMKTVIVSNRVVTTVRKAGNNTVKKVRRQGRRA
jgi:hypothetical protein